MDQFAALIMGALVFLVPIVAILTAHQRKMAEIVHGRGAETSVGPAVHDRLAALERELFETRDSLRRQALEIDDLKAKVSGEGLLADRFVEGGDVSSQA